MVIIKINNPDKEYRSNNHIVYSCQYHIVFCPKYRRKVLEEDIAKRLKELVKIKCEELNCNIIEMEVMPDHVHLLLDVDPYISVLKTVNQIKGHLSRNLREEFPSLKSRLPSLWTHDKFISTVGDLDLKEVKKYIANQEGK